MCNLCILRTNEDTDSVFQMYDSACIFRTSEDVRTSEDSDMKSSPINELLEAVANRRIS